jgi:hypothetical protein
MSGLDFFQHLIDGYLFLDLRNMSEVEQKEGENGGGVGYPMLSTCVSGMELLGGLLYGKDYHHSRDWEYFEHYWNEYLVKVDGRYAPYSKLFWSLVRNGVAHTYMAKAAITVTKGKKEHHLVFYDDGAKFNIDCFEFYRDFLTSYQKYVRPKLANDDPFTSQVEKNVNLLLEESNDFCKKVFAELKAARSPQSPAGHFAPTPSGTGPSTTTTTLIPDEVRQSLHANPRRISGASLADPQALAALRKQQEQGDGPPATMSGAI